ncbi:hypothetical protein H0H93_013385, partial [Arthromyces matolae]
FVRVGFSADLPFTSEGSISFPVGLGNIRIGYVRVTRLCNMLGTWLSLRSLIFPLGGFAPSRLSTESRIISSMLTVFLRGVGNLNGYVPRVFESEPDARSSLRIAMAISSTGAERVELVGVQIFALSIPFPTKAPRILVGSPSFAIWDFLCVFVGLPGSDYPFPKADSTHRDNDAFRDWASDSIARLKRRHDMGSPWRTPLITRTVIGL